MSLYTIGDTHLSLGTAKPMDIFQGWEGYVEKLKKNWNSIVKETDTVVIPGDISWAMNLEEFRLDAAFLNELPGKKLLIKGNHDYWWTTAKKINDFFNEYGFDSLSIIHNSAVIMDGIGICGSRGWFYEEAGENYEKILNREVGRIETSLSIARKNNVEPVAFLHFPPVYGDMVCEEIIHVLKKYEVGRCYYGHIHGKAQKNAFEGLFEGIRFKMVSCDSVDFTPVLVENDHDG